MALSCYANWGEVEHINSEVNIFVQPQMELLQQPELLPGYDHNFAFSDPYIDPLFESQELIYSENYSSLLPYVSSPSDNLYTLVPEIFPVEEYDTYSNPKRHKPYEESCFNIEIMPGLCNGFVPNPCLLQELSPEVLGPFPDLSPPPVLYSSKISEPVKKPGNGGSLSAQSIAARQRRRKITEKTQELGKLIPGGQKMNTAEMFQASFKYIKFLQAQVGILESTGCIQENGESFNNQELENLLGSSLIQEKLYSAEKCLVPKKFVQAIADDHKLQSNNQAFLEVKKWLSS